MKTIIIHIFLLTFTSMAFSENPSLTSIQEQIEKLSSDKTLKNQDKSFLRAEIIQNLESLMKSNDLTKDALETALGIARQKILQVGNSKPTALRLEKDILQAIDREEVRKRDEERRQAKKEEEERLKNEQREQLQTMIREDLKNFFDSVTNDSTSAELVWRLKSSGPYNILEDAAQQIGDFLKQRQNIESFTLSGDRDGYIFPDLGKIIVSSLSPRISTLIVKIHGLNDLSMLNNLTKLKVQLHGCSAFPQVPPSIEDLDISDSCIYEHTVERIAALRNLKKINLKGTRKTYEWSDDKWREGPIAKAWKEQLRAHNPGIEIVE